MTSTSPFKLSCQLPDHSGDVRSISTLQLPSGTDLILSGSRDQTAKLWARKAGERDFGIVETLGGNGGFVNSTAFLQTQGQVIALTSGQDSLINGYPITTSPSSNSYSSGLTIPTSPEYSLVGHKDNVCTLDVFNPQGTFGGAEAYLVSGSWDKTAKVWKGWKEVAEFKGHLQAVWSVKCVDEDKVLTASADKLVRLWSIKSPSEPIAIFSGHTDAVRGLEILDDGKGFASCGNDGTINLYSLASYNVGSTANQPALTLHGHTSFVYSLSMLPGEGNEGEGVVSSGEDGSLRVWGEDGSLVQTITIPAISVWTVSTLNNGDLVCGSSDNFVRVFTRSQKMIANGDELKAYETTISSQALNKTQVGDIKAESLPGPEALQVPGTQEGQTKMIRSGSLIEAHQWSTATSSWVKIGEVVGGVGNSQKQLYKGKEYDHVFDVDIADGIPPLKLPYNLSENPYGAAQKFLEANDLPSAYTDQVVKFIEKNTEGVELGGGSGEFVDPYTGASRYTANPAGATRPSNNANRGTHQSNNSNWNQNNNVNSINGGVGNNVDPFTRSEPKKPPPQTAIIPMKTFLSFKTLNIPMVKTKILQFNGQVDPSVAMSPTDLKTLDNLLSSLTRGPSALPLDLSLLQTLLVKWPTSLRFPVLDVYRLASVGSSITPPEDVSIKALEAADWSKSWPSDDASKKEKDTLSMIALRCVVNSWNRNDGKSREGLERNGELILASLRGKGPSSHFRHLGKNGRIAFSTVLLNFSVHLVGSMQPSTLASPTLELIVDVLSQEEGDAEVIYRSLVALGNLLVAKSATSLQKSSTSIAKDLSENWASASKEERIKLIHREVLIKEALVRGV